METKQASEEPQVQTIQTEHPWLELPESSLDEDIRYSLDELRFA